MTAFPWPQQPAPGTAAAKAALILSDGTALLQQLARRRVANYASFWSDPVAVAAAMGTKAAEVFAADAALAAMLGPRLAAAGAPSDLIAAATAGVPAGWSVAYNSDGSVNVTATP